MVLKTFNVQEEVYSKYSKYCKERGISMSKQVTMFMKVQTEDEPEVREEYLAKLKKIEKEGRIHIGTIEDFRKRYGIKEDV
ncbi:DUF2683 family protein [Candidatus Woesearchaeota archaeon]|nr:DUF2683 family protein [Candidatus Woesearchaeota archaeon]